MHSLSLKVSSTDLIARIESVGLIVDIAMLHCLALLQLCCLPSLQLIVCQKATLYGPKKEQLAMSAGLAVATAAAGELSF